MFTQDEEADVSDDWITELGEKLIKPKIKMSRLESLSWRLRRNYVFILPIIFSVWFFKVGFYPFAVQNLFEFFNNASVGFLPGEFIFLGMMVSLIVAVLIAFTVSRKQGRSDLP